mmetsp:Transcript_5872/g.36418  ORF Transcript_5872/g.36418 Transcript_5872/m.36418 type:complete len:86 (+) Transcript_5872:128-385(+)
MSESRSSMQASLTSSASSTLIQCHFYPDPVLRKLPIPLAAAYCDNLRNDVSICKNHRIGDKLMLKRQPVAVLVPSALNRCKDCFQ